MIVRILHEGQFEIRGAVLDELNDVDNQIVEAIAHGDDERFRRLMDQMHDIVLKRGSPVPVDVFEESDIILPPADATMQEVEEMFTGEGMIPG